MIKVYAYHFDEYLGALRVFTRSEHRMLPVYILDDSESPYKSVLREFSKTHGLAPIGPLEIPDKVLNNESIKVSDVKFLASSPLEPRTVIYDIETLTTTNEFSSPDNPGDQIYMITAWSSSDQVARAFIQRHIDPIPGINLSTFNDEVSLIQGFVGWLKDDDPDLIVGYNNRYFDDRFLRIRGDRYRITIPRVLSLDVYRFARYFGEQLRGPMRNFRLDTVAKTVLGRGKLDVDFRELQRAYHEMSERPTVSAVDVYARGVKYAMEDTLLTRDLYKAFSVIDHLAHMARLTFLEPVQILMTPFSQWDHITINTTVFNDLSGNDVELAPVPDSRTNLYIPNAVLLTLVDLIPRAIEEVLKHEDSDSILIDQISVMRSDQSRLRPMMMNLITSLFNHLTPRSAGLVNICIKSTFDLIRSRGLPVLAMDYHRILIPRGSRCSADEINGLIKFMYSKIPGLIVKISEGSAYIDSYTKSMIVMYFRDDVEGLFHFKTALSRWNHFEAYHEAHKRFYHGLLYRGRSVLHLLPITHVDHVKMPIEEITSIPDQENRDLMVRTKSGVQRLASQVDISSVDIDYYNQLIEKSLRVPVMYL